MEKQQQEILVRNIEVDYLCRHYKSSPPKSLGQILSFIYVFCGFDIMERVQVGEGKVYLDGGVVADFTFNGMDLPYFYFREGFVAKDRAELRQRLFFDDVLPKQARQQ